MDTNDLYQRIQLLLGEAREEVLKSLPKDEHPNGTVTPRQLAFYLEGMILALRGPSEKSPNPFEDLSGNIDNNKVLKKLRVAYNLKSEELQQIFAFTGEDLSTHEINSFFRSEGHKHYKTCSWPVLLTFIEGLKVFLKGRS